MKMEFICRDCNIEIDNDDDDTKDELMVHCNKFHNELINRCRKFMQKLYNGYRFRDYTDINNSVIDDKDHFDDLNKTLNDLKDSIKADLKEYIRTNLKLVIFYN